MANKQFNFIARLKGLFSGHGGQTAHSATWGFGSSVFPSSQFDYKAKVGNTWSNSAVMSCLGYMMRTIPEATPQVVRWEGGRPKILTEHPLLDLLDNPNPDTSGHVLWQATVISFAVDGNAYWRIVRNAAGKPIQLWHVPFFMMAPQWDPKGEENLTHYSYRVDGAEYRLSKDDVIHFKFGEDPENTRLGISPLKAGFREIYTDNEASTFTAAILRNSGIPSVMISPQSADFEISAEAREELVEQWQQQFTGEGRGKPFAASLPINLAKVGYTPEELALDKIRQIPETRICSLLGVPPAVIGLSSGDGQRLYSNLEQAREIAFDTNIRSAQAQFAVEIQRQLMPYLANAKTDKLRWDYSEVACLQDRRDKKATRIERLYKAGIIDRAQAKSEMDYPFDDVDRGIYFNLADLMLVEQTAPEKEPALSG